MKDTTEPPKTNPPSIHLNLEDWLPYFEASGLTEAEKVETIETLWNIAMGFVDLGWTLNVDAENTGQSFDLTAALRAAVLYSQENEEQEAL
ncbi:hypothetical protein ROLI_010600 [Roseobacter fucihabitans]|uniref:Uncharacterized protein n=1 Tax=Roseobacter fucihabitans TaxID=1537242 RepID=A0ABZ2BQI2_9RHOB|nr:hypothetical protein [Roseobacter litoralis]MBC6964860.1 hypothetical protein [Roseobacter litoralis]MBC6965520.1 hypothetical protein [Roseobacter litoralis]